MWERFSYYGMRALLVLFLMADTSTGGFGWNQNEALTLYGWYTMAVYLMSVPGGILADRVFGQKKMVMIGGFFTRRRAWFDGLYRAMGIFSGALPHCFRGRRTKTECVHACWRTLRRRRQKTRFGFYHLLHGN